LTLMTNDSRATLIRQFVQMSLPDIFRFKFYLIMNLWRHIGSLWAWAGEAAYTRRAAYTEVAAASPGAHGQA
jgi:hypothetical protein